MLARPGFVAAPPKAQRARHSGTTFVAERTVMASFPSRLARRSRRLRGSRAAGPRCARFVAMLGALAGSQANVAEDPKCCCFSIYPT
jgi:hypothetical protein